MNFLQLNKRNNQLAKRGPGRGILFIISILAVVFMAFSQAQHEGNDTTTVKDTSVNVLQEEAQVMEELTQETANLESRSNILISKESGNISFT